MNSFNIHGMLARSVRRAGWFGAAAVLAIITMAPPPLAAAADAQEDTQGIRVVRAIEVGSDGWLGFSYDLDVDGVIVQEVVDGSPADEAGLEEFDLLLRVNGRKATMRYLGQMSSELEPGDTVRLRVRRDGDERELRITAENRESPLAVYLRGEMPIHLDALMGEVEILLDSTMAMIETIEIPEFAFERGESEYILRFDGERMDTIRFNLEGALEGWDTLSREFGALDAGFHARAFDPWLVFGERAVAGAEFEELNPKLAEYFDSDYGVLVVDVSSGTPADRAGLEPGDVVVSAAGEIVRSLDDFREAIYEAPEDQPVMIRVIRHGDRHTLEIEHE